MPRGNNRLGRTLCESARNACRSGSALAQQNTPDHPHAELPNTQQITRVHTSPSGSTANTPPRSLANTIPVPTITP